MNIQLNFAWGLVGSGHDLPAEEIDLCLPEGTSIRHLLEDRGISIQDIGMISVNGS